MLKKNKETISLYLTEETFKAVQVKGHGPTAQVMKLVVKDLATTAESELPKTLRGLLKGFNTKSAQIVYVVPAAVAITKNIEVPSTDPEEIKSIVGLQAGRHTPFSREEIQAGYVNIGVYKNNYTKILLVIANKNTLKKQLDILEKAGVSVHKVAFPPENIARLYSDWLGLTQESAPTGIIHLTKESTDFILAFKGLAIASRNIPIGEDLLASDGDSALEQLTDELSKTIESYQSDDIEQLPSNYVITTDTPYTQNLQAVLTEKLKWMAEIVPYPQHIKAAKGMMTKIEDLMREVSLLDVIASALAVRESQVDLLPREIQLKKSVEEQGREVFFAATCALIILVLAACTLGARMYFRNAFLVKLKKEYEGKRKQVALLRQTSLRSRIVQNYLQGRMVSLDIIKELYQRVPDQIYLTGVFMDEDGNISIQGISDIASLVFNLGTSLKESKLFQSVQIKSTTAKKDRGKDVTSFEITLSLNNSE